MINYYVLVGIGIGIIIIGVPFCSIAWSIYRDENSSEYLKGYKDRFEDYVGEIDGTH
jgi:hypothetical protein